jgi:hypothetical protein
MALLVAAAVFATYAKVKQIGWDERDVIAQAEAKEADRLSGILGQKRVVVTEKIVTKYIDRIKVIEREGAEVIRYVDRLIPVGTPDLPGGFRVLHDAAASGRFPDSPGGVDAARAPPVPASIAAETVAGNYQACRLNAEQLTALQDWVHAQFTLENAR